MDSKQALEQVENYLAELLKDRPDTFLVRSKVKPTNNIKLYLDSDTGIRVEDCIQINRSLRRQIEETGMFGDEDFSLEVSSPGLDEPLVLHRQFVKNVGRGLEVELHDGGHVEGDLKATSETGIELETTEGKGKKAVTKMIEIPFGNIKKATVQIKF